MIELRGYLDGSGRKPFESWFETLDPTAAAKVTVALTRIEQGNLSNAKGVGAGVHEYRIDFRPGYRVYGRDGGRIVILLGGGANARGRTFRWRGRTGPTISGARNWRPNSASDS